MSWLKAIAALLGLLDKLAEWLERRELIRQGQRDEQLANLQRAQDARKASDNIVSVSDATDAALRRVRSPKRHEDGNLS